MQGYPEARDMDDKIKQMLANDPINKDNALRWLNFARTLKTSCNAIISQAELVSFR